MALAAALSHGNSTCAPRYRGVGPESGEGGGKAIFTATLCAIFFTVLFQGGAIFDFLDRYKGFQVA